MDKFSILGIITLGIILTSLLFAIFLLLVETKNKLSNRLMAWYFIVFSIHMSVLFYANYIELPLVFDRLRDQIMFLSSPLLYLYVLSTVYSDFKLKPKYLLHLIPFLIEVVVYFPRFYLVNNQDRNIFYNNFNANIEVKFSSIFGVVVILFYLILVFSTLRKYKNILLENYSYHKAFNYKWMLQFFILLSSIFILSVIKQIYKFYGTDIEILNTIRIILTLFTLCFLFWIILKSMLNPELFKGINKKHQLVQELIENESSENQDKNIEKKIEDLREFIETNEPFLETNLTIQKLANQLNYPVKEFSILINHHLGQHFFDFVNEYRIKKAIQIFKNTKDKKLTIIEVLYEVGFNSKSPFNIAFKKHAGLTPTEYRKTKL